MEICRRWLAQSMASSETSFGMYMIAWLCLSQNVRKMLPVWADSCPCHPRSLLHLSGLTYFKARRAWQRSLRQSPPCSMRIRRGPELACGQVTEVLAQAKRQFACEVVALTGGLTLRERQTVLQDWQVGSDRLSHIMRAKFWFLA